MTMLLLSILLLVLLVGAVAFWRHQQLLKVRAHLMREAVRNREFTFALPTGGLFPGERALQQALNDLGQDISKLVAQNEVESWQRLTRVLTHEIMNVTTPIQSISQAYLRSPQIAGTPYEEGIRAIHEASLSLLSFVESYRKLTQLQEPVPVDVPLHEFVASIRSLYPALEWTADLPPSCRLHTDESLLRQVFINLVKNAVEAGARRILVSWDGGLCFSNDGRPIPAEVRREIFIPFFTTKSGGSGIGLSLSRQILMRQGLNLTLLDTAATGYHVTFCISG